MKELVARVRAPSSIHANGIAALACLLLTACPGGPDKQAEAIGPPAVQAREGQPRFAVNNDDPAWVFRDEAKPAKTAVVFIHGIFGSTLGTWTNGDGTTFFQLLKADKDVGPKVDVYAFGFQSNMFGGKGSLDVREGANKLGLFLSTAHVLDYDSIVLVGHSMGGLVALRYLASKLPGDRAIAAKFPLVVLYATPQEGADVAALARLALENPGLANMTPADDNQWLQQFLSDWTDMKSEVKPQVVCAYEKIETYGKIIVPWTSSTRLCTESGQAIEGADHISIVKPNRPAHPAVALLVDAIQRQVLSKQIGARIELPDFKQEGAGWRAVMDRVDQSYRILNAGRTDLSFWTSDRSPKGLVVLPDEGVTTVKGHDAGTLRLLSLRLAQADEYTFRIKSTQGDDMVIKVTVDRAQIRSEAARTASFLVSDFNAHLRAKGDETAAGLAQVAAQRIAKEHPGLPEGLRWIVTADVLSSTALEQVSIEAMRKATELTPEAAKSYLIQKEALRKSTLPAGSVKANDIKVQVVTPKLDFSQLAKAPYIGAKDSYLELAKRLQSSPELATTGYLLESEVQGGLGNAKLSESAYLRAMKREEIPRRSEMQRSAIPRNP